MEPIAGAELRSGGYGGGLYQLEDELTKVSMAPPPESGNSFTALLGLPPSQAVELLHSDGGAGDVLRRHRISALNNQALHFPADGALIERAARYSVFAGEEGLVKAVKQEPCSGGSESDKTTPLKRKEREKKGKGTSKKSKTTPLSNQNAEEGVEKLPYVHVRARRGQATDSHSLAERARREKINARMKLLQELVPGCNKISGTALVLDEIINHVQSLQRQVEYLSMRLAAVNPKIDFNLDGLISAGTESMVDCNFPNMAMPFLWPEVQLNADRQQFQHQLQFESLNQPVWVKEENHHNLVNSENSLLSYDSSANSASMHSSQLKMEL